jgi:hypothetical protein
MHFERRNSNGRVNLTNWRANRMRAIAIGLLRSTTALSLRAAYRPTLRMAAFMDADDLFDSFEFGDADLAAIDRIEAQHAASTSRVTLEDIPITPNKNGLNPRRALIHTSSNVFVDVSPSQEPAAAAVKECPEAPPSQPKSLFQKYRWCVRLHDLHQLTGASRWQSLSVTDLTAPGYCEYKFRYGLMGRRDLPVEVGQGGREGAL